MIDVPTSPTSLEDLLGSLPRHTGTVGLQAPEANVQIVYFGDAKIQPFELRPKANAHLPVTSYREVFILGTVGDKLAVALFDT